MTWKTVIISAVILIVAGVASWQILDKFKPRASGSAQSGKALIGGKFSLTDHTGKRVTEKDFAGKYMLVYFGYTFCPDVCPTELQVMSDALAKLGERAKEVIPILVTIDPERDGVKEMAAYVTAFDKRLVGLTGTPEEIAKAAKSYRVYYAKVVKKGEEDNKDYAMDHSAIVYLMDRKGEYAAHFTYGTKPEVMADKIREILDKAGV